VWFLKLRRCPECGTELPVRELLDAAPKAPNGNIAGAVGLTCPACYAQLRLQMWLQPLAISGATILSLLVASRLPTDESTHLFLALILAASFASWLMLPSLAMFRKLKPGEVVACPLEEKARRDAEDLRQFRQQEAEREAEQALEYETSGPWICDRCQEENPQEFSVCWKCTAEMPERFRTHPAA
jgi:hypothetical protein